jgi:hypothetical protein
MPLFQRTVLKEFVAEQNKAAIEAAYELFKAHFAAPETQEMIRKAKEEQYQEGFLQDLFVNVLGYTLFPQQPHNLITELKNPNDARKADGAILFDEQVKAVIELKDTRTTIMRSIEAQAFSYKYQYQNCRYVITSNFQYLNFYIDNAYECETFDLFQLSYEEFAVLYTLLQKDNLQQDIPIALKSKSREREQQLTLDFYNDYQAFKDLLFLHVAQVNKQYDPLLLFEKVQKILDRVIFMCFVSDKGLLRINQKSIMRHLTFADTLVLEKALDQIVKVNLVQAVVTEYYIIKDFGTFPVNLYDLLLGHFKHLDKGFKSRLYKIDAFNGGLFASDEVIDCLKIDDNVLVNCLEKISHYNFDTDIDVNVLGHIFEYSLSQLDQKRIELLQDLETVESGGEPQFAGLRKVDGIFYTPIHITQYIIQETIGKVCNDQKTSLELDTIDVENIEQKTAIQEKITQYENWLKGLRVLDPACGSGAFLNQVFQFFIQEYKWVESIKMAVFPPKKEEKETHTAHSIFEKNTTAPIQKKPKNWYHEVLENNIFGVDLNQESVAITKLSLWLKTAQERQQLNDLSDNIKIGNSLIADDSVDKKAFDWKTAFPQVTNGFHIIVGNPPYVRQEIISEKHKNYYAKHYPAVFNGTADLYVYFYAKSLELLTENGVLGFITPNKWFKTKYGEGLRRTLQDLKIHQIVDFFELRVFEDAATEPQIIVVQKTNSQDDFAYYPVTQTLLGEEGLEKFADKLTEKIIIQKSYLNEKEWTLAGAEKQLILEKINGKIGQIKTVSLNDYSGLNIYRGITTGLNDAFVIDRKTKESLIKQHYSSAELIKPYMQSTDIKKWHLENKNEWFFIATGYDTVINEKNYPAIFKHLQKYENKLAARSDQGKTPFNLRACDYYPEFDKPKIIYIHTAVEHCFYYDTNGYYLNNSCYMITNIDKFLSAYLNSSVFNFYKKLKFVAYGNPSERGRNKLDYNKMIDVPIPILTKEQKQPFEQLVDRLQQLSAELNRQNSFFFQAFVSSFQVKKVSKKLQYWYNLEWSEFEQEVKKLRGNISVKEKSEWLETFAEKQRIIQDLQQSITIAETEINQRLYEYYDFTEQEIKQVEAV